jgi:hypothetical protein
MPHVFSMTYIHKFQPKIDIPWHVQHKLYYFHFLTNFSEKKGCQKPWNFNKNSHVWTYNIYNKITYTLISLIESKIGNLWTYSDFIIFIPYMPKFSKLKIQMPN